MKKRKISSVEFPIESLERRTDLEGGTFEFVRDCSFDAPFLQFIRGTVKRITWHEGKPCVIYFRDALECVERNFRLEPWMTSDRDRYHCRTTRDDRCLDDTAFTVAWTQGEGLVFKAMNGDHCFLMPAGLRVSSGPLLYRTPRQRAGDDRKIFRILGIVAKPRTSRKR